MNPRELRIGNLVSIFNSICVIDTVALHGCWCTLLESEKDRSLTLEYDNAYIEPIPLTEEWLLKFGFEKNELSRDYCFGEWKIPKTWGQPLYMGWYDSPNPEGEKGYIIDGVENYPIQYVHQLQNLIFALTGEELQ